MLEIFLTIYMVLICGIFLNILAGTAFDSYYDRSKKVFLLGCSLLIITWFTHGLLILWANG